MPTDFNNQAKSFLDKFLNGMSTKEAKEIIALTSAYEKVVDSLQKEINALSQIDAKSLNQVFKDRRYKDFLGQAEAQLNDYANGSSTLISVMQKQYAQAGLQTTQGLLTTLTRDFNLLPVDSINNIVGFTADGSPLQEVLINRYGDSFQEVADTLVDAVAKGLNPNETAKLIGESLQGNLSDTLRIARTEQMRAFRSASLAQMKESGVVDGWEWVTEPNACEFCESMNGKVFSLDTALDSHPNCRCIQAPHINRGNEDITSQAELNSELEDAGLTPQDEELNRQLEYLTKDASPGYAQLLRQNPELIAREFEFASKMNKESQSLKILHAQNEARRKRGLIFQRTGKQLGQEIIAEFGLQNVYKARTLESQNFYRVLKINKELNLSEKEFNALIRFFSSKRKPAKNDMPALQSIFSRLRDLTKK